MRRLFDFVRTDDLPHLARPNYAAELRQIMGWGIVAGSIEGSMVSVVASKTFGASELLTTVVWATPVVMNVLNVVWGSLLRGRPRKQAFFAVTLCGAAAVASVGLVSEQWHPWGGWVFALQIATVHLFNSGLVTLRTTMWRANYPATHRARIAGRLQTVRLGLSVLTSLGLSLLYNVEPSSYRFVYPAVGLIWALSLLTLHRFRTRGERTELRRYRAHARTQPSGNGRGLWGGLREAAEILRTDTLFARYMLAQFLLGAANFFTDPILVNALTKDLRFDYLSAQAVLYLIPTAALLVSIRFWAPLFDRIGVLRFRIYNSACWGGSYVFVFAAMMLLVWLGTEWVAIILPVLVIARVLNGLGRGGGAIAWTIGHLHFAREHQTELYMGIHVALTGLRGLLMPFAGFAMKEWFGYAALVVPILLATTAHLMFRKLAAEGRSDD